MTLSHLTRRKLIKPSLNTTLLMTLLSLAPILATRHLPIKFYLISIPLFFINIYIVWAINLIITHIAERQEQNRKTKALKYISSYIFSSLASGFFVLFIKSTNIYANFESVNAHPHTHSMGNLSPFVMAIVTNTFVLFIQEMVLLHDKKTKFELENARLKLENMEAAKNQLKKQIHPHFLFNSMSILKSLIKENPSLAEEYIIRLSGFLRASISSVESNTVKLKDELKLCTDFIEMQKIRFGNALIFEYNIPDDIVRTANIPGFALQVLLENAIKHNALTEDSPLKLCVRYSNGWLTVENNIQQKMSLESSTKMGLKNLSERYKILTGSDIVIENSDEKFKVTIKVIENESCNHRR